MLVEDLGIPEREAGLSLMKAANDRARAAEKELSRHPGGTKAGGLRKDKKNQSKSVRGIRDRFGEAEEQSSRMRRDRRALTHAVRAKGKRELQRQTEITENEQDDTF